MTPQEQSKLAGEILTALRTADNPTEVAHPGEPPSTERRTEEAARKIQGAYQQRLETYANYLLSKPTGQWTEAERTFMWAEWGKHRRGE